MQFHCTPKMVARFWSAVDCNGPLPEHDPSLGPCWIWTGRSRSKEGYGAFSIKGRDYRAHRIAFIITYNSIPPGAWILHHCDRPACVRPSHLYAGTPRNNTDDAMRRGRLARGDRNGSVIHPDRLLRGEHHPNHIRPERLRRGDQHYARLTPERLPRGEQHGCATLTSKEVISIRKQYATGAITLASLATIFSTTPTTIWSIVHRRTWKHLP